jgi:tetratricopeptide (TPR) repeat protein
MSYGALALASYAMGRMDTTLQAAQRAIELNPSMAFAHLMGGVARIHGGDDPEKGIRMVSRGIALNPQDPGLAWSFGGRAIGNFVVHRHDDAVSDARAAIKLRYGYLFGRVVLTAALAEMGAIEEARKELQTMLGIHPDFTPALLDPYTFSNEADRERLIAGLRMAGLIE